MRNSNNMVIEKVCGIISYLRQGNRGITSHEKGEKKRIKRKDKERIKKEKPKEVPQIEAEVPAVIAEDDDE